MSVSVKKTGVVNVSGGTNMNLMPNSYIMPLGTNNPATGTWRLAGSNNMTRSRVLIENGMYGFQNSGIQTTPSGGYVDASCYGINNFPMEANTDYILSMWARITEGTEGYAGYSIYASSYVDGSDTKTDRGYRVTPLTKEWQRVWIHFKTNATENRNIYIGITTGETEVTTQMCLIKLEKGSVLTPWIPFLTDDIAVADYSAATLSGEIVSFNDGANNIPLQSLKVLVEAQQDLHDYDKPWAGGAGANLWGGDGMLQDFINANITGFVYDTTAKTLSFGAPQIAGKTIKAFPNAKPNTAYTLIISAQNTANTTHANLVVYYTDGTYIAIKAPTSLNTKQTFTLVTNASKTIESVRGGNYNGYTTIYYDECCVLEGVKTANDFVPWENICPISGWSGANVTRTGKNLFVNTTPIAGRYLSYNGSQILYSGWNISDYIPIKGGETYHFKPNSTLGSSAYGFFYTDNSIDTTIQSSRFVSGEVTITAPSEARYVRFSYRDTSTDIQLEIGSQATAYVAPLGNTYTIAFGDTYYGGELDVTNGVLMVINGFYTFDGTETPIAYGSGWRYVVLSGKEAKSYGGAEVPTNLISNTYVAISRNSISSGASGISITGDTVLLSTNSPSGVQLVYELTTPIEIQLTPQQIAQLAENNVFADTGEVSECKYVSHSSQVDTNFIETHPLLTQINNSYINSNNFIEI